MSAALVLMLILAPQDTDTLRDAIQTFNDRKASLQQKRGAVRSLGTIKKGLRPLSKILVHAEPDLRLEAARVLKDTRILIHGFKHRNKRVVNEERPYL